MNFKLRYFLKTKLGWPQIQRPKMVFPKIRYPKITMPRIRVPKILWPQLRLPLVRWPQYSLPSIKIPAVKWNFNSQYIQGLSLIFVWIFIIVIIGSGVWASGFYPRDTIKNTNLLKLSQLQNIQGEKIETQSADSLNTMTPAAGNDNLLVENNGRYPFEESVLRIEAVLIPHDTTVISSSKDSKIKAINFDNGELFKKNDILVEYICKDAQAEIDIARIQQNLAQKKSMSSYKLFKLDIISDIEKQELETENKQAKARIGLYESRMENCFIRAEYDGRIVKRLANPGEFTRTDRVLMEVASLEHLKAEFLLPSRWLRWVNIGAPVDVMISETEKSYPAKIKYIYGEVDPVSQSIQVTAQLLPYEDPLLPGMSGAAILDVQAIRNNGIYGFLEKKPENYGQ